MAAPELTKADFQSDQETRWCPGCGDYAVLAAVQGFFPELGIPPERVVFVSGIGCAGRFAYYMDTYGMHGIHGRGPALATGLAAARDDLSIWVVTGDGDALSIGGNHLIHALRRNVPVKILLFNNQIYGLTKGQASPTSELGKVTKSTPFGSIDGPFNPVSLALGAEATFVARTIDTDKHHLPMVLRAAAAHEGAALVEIYQNCPVFNDGAFDALRDKKQGAVNRILLEHGQPIRSGEYGVVRGEFGELRIVPLSEVDEAALVVHDAHRDDPSLAFALSRLSSIAGRADADRDLPRRLAAGQRARAEHRAGRGARGRRRRAAGRGAALGRHVDDRLRARRSDKWTKYPPDVLPAWVAEMDFELAPPVREALVRAVELGDLGYIGNVDGLLAEFAALHGAAARVDGRADRARLRRDGRHPGGRCGTCTAPGDGVVITPPCYPPYFAEIPRDARRGAAAGGLLARLRRASTGRSRRARGRWCSATRTTRRGGSRRVDELQRLASLADAWGVHVIADEIHAPLTLRREFTTWAKVSENGSVLTSASKAFNLPALKLAFVVGAVADELPEDLRDHAGLLGVIAAEAAFRDGDAWLDETIATIRANHALVRDGAAGGRARRVPAAGRLPDVARLPRGRARATIRRRRSSSAGAWRCIPGRAFGAPGAGFARLNVGTTPELVEEARQATGAALAR